MDLVLEVINCVLHVCMCLGSFGLFPGDPFGQIPITCIGSSVLFAMPCGAPWPHRCPSLACAAVMSCLELARVLHLCLMLPVPAFEQVRATALDVEACDAHKVCICNWAVCLVVQLLVLPHFPEADLECPVVEVEGLCNDALRSSSVMVPQLFSGCCGICCRLVVVMHVPG